MSGELEKILAETAIGIGKTRIRQKLSVRRISETGILTDKMQEKKFVQGQGIVKRQEETLPVFDCDCIWSKDAYAGRCHEGHIVCREHILVCSTEGCFRKLCRIADCRSHFTVNGIIFCRRHGPTAAILSIFGAGPRREERRVRNEPEERREPIPRTFVPERTPGQRFIEPRNIGNVPRRPFGEGRNEANGRIPR